MFIQQLYIVSPAFAIFALVFAAILGAVMGSFVNCVAWRKVHGESAMKGRSHCPHCDHPLSTGDLVPIFSWVALKGTCRYCGEKIGARYVVSELILTIAFPLVIWCLGITLYGFALCALCCILLALSLTDLEKRIIPNTFILTALIIWAVVYVLSLLSYIGVIPAVYAEFCGFGVMETSITGILAHLGELRLGSLFLSIAGGNGALAVLLDSIAGGLGISVLMLACSFVFDLVTKKSSLGAGDVKLFFVTGMYLGLATNLLNLLLSCIIGAVFGTIYTRMQKEGQGSAFPFGPAIAVSTLICALAAPAIIGAYLGLFGL